MKNFFYRVFCGFFLGISVFAPGVSGSVMAVMMGIYDKLLDIVSNPFKNFKKNFFYLLPMGIGAIISFILFILVFSYLFEAYEKATYLLFMALIAGNLPVVFKDANKDGFKKRYIFGILIAFSIALTLGILRANAIETEGVSEDSISLFYFGICGAIAGISSMIPGMSISMILMILGVYNPLMQAAKSINIPIILVVGICFVTAMVLFSRLTKFVFDRYHSFAYFMVFGFMCGSLVSIYLGLPKDDINFNWLIGSIMIITGLFISLLFVFLSKKFNTTDNIKDPA